MEFSRPLSFQIWGSLAIAAFLVAYAASRDNLTGFVAVFLAALLGLAFFFFGALRLWLRWKQSGELNRKIEEQLSLARNLSSSEAEQRALVLLNDFSKFQIVMNPAPPDSLAQLGPSLQKFFSSFESVKETNGDTLLDRAEIGPSRLREGFLRIGTDMDSTEIVVRPHEDTIHIIGSPGPDEISDADGFPTVYHFLVAGYQTEHQTEPQLPSSSDA
jgi:hypothetical protein